MRTLSLTATALLSMLVLGCSESALDSSVSSPGEHRHDEHNHEAGHGHGGHGHPKTLEEGLLELTNLRDTVRDAFAADDVDKAHGPLHEVGHLLEDITGLFERQDLTPEQRDTAKQNVDILFDMFGKVDSTLHGQDGESYKAVSDEIDAAITALLSVAKAGEAEQSDSHGGESSEE